MTSFAMFSQKDLISLIDLQAPHSAIGVYGCLLAYSLDSESCFPSIATICKWLKNSISKRSVYRALNWLVENDFIDRKDKGSKDRFVIKSRVTTCDTIRNKEDNNNKDNNNNIFINNILMTTCGTIEEIEDPEKIMNCYLLDKKPLTENKLNIVRHYLNNNENYKNWLIVFHYQVYEDIMNKDLSVEERKDIEDKWNMEIEKDYLQLFDRGNKNEDQNCKEKEEHRELIRRLQNRNGSHRR